MVERQGEGVELQPIGTNYDTFNNQRACEAGYRSSLASGMHWLVQQQQQA
jgi:hypothetical protein